MGDIFSLNLQSKRTLRVTATDISVIKARYMIKIRDQAFRGVYDMGGYHIGSNDIVPELYAQ